MINPFTTVVELYGHGGFDVRTPVGGTEPTLLRTVVQPYGDLITHVVEGSANNPELWEDHFRRVAAAKNVLDVAAAAVRGTSFVSILVWAAMGILATLQYVDNPSIGAVMSDYAPGLVFGLSLALTRALVQFLRWRIRWAIKSWG